MRITCSVVPCILAVLASVSCTSTEPSAEYLRASIDGAAWEAGSWQNWPVDGLYHHGPYETPFFAIGGVGVVGPDRWQLGIYMPAAEGTYLLAPTATTGFIVIRVIGGATNGVADIIFSPDSLEPGTVTLTRWDPERRIIEGTFSLRGREHGTLESVSMTNGVFRVRYDDPSLPAQVPAN